MKSLRAKTYSQDKICTLLGYYAAYFGNYLPSFRVNLWFPSSGDLESGTDRFDPKRRQEFTSIHCVVSQKSAGLFCVAAVA